MPSIFVLKEKITSPMEWYSRMMKKTAEWEFDNLLETYHLGSVYLFESSNGVSFDDMSEEEFFGWKVSSWIALADGKELIYGYYNEDSGNAEFVHIKNGIAAIFVVIAAMLNLSTSKTANVSESIGCMVLRLKQTKALHRHLLVGWMSPNMSMKICCDFFIPKARITLTRKILVYIITVRTSAPVW